MPRYFFNLYNHEPDIDSEGTELASPDQARLQGVIFAGQYLSDHPELIWDGSRLTVEVRDKERTVLLLVDIVARDPHR